MFDLVVYIRTLSKYFLIFYLIHKTSCITVSCYGVNKNLKISYFEGATNVHYCSKVFLNI